MITSDWIPRGEIWLMRGDGYYGTRIVCARWNRYGERLEFANPPLWTRHSAGVIEAARAKRREWKKSSAYKPKGTERR